MLRKNVVAVIPARANSKRIPGKNYKKFNGKLRFPANIPISTKKTCKKNCFFVWKQNHVRNFLQIVGKTSTLLSCEARAQENKDKNSKWK